MIGWVWVSVALAGEPDLSHFAGSWGLDPSKSDDPGMALSMAIDLVPDVRMAKARQMSPDGGASVDEDAPKHALDDATVLLGGSGGLVVDVVDASVVVTWTGESPVTLPLTRHYVKVKGERKWRARAWMDGDHLVVERRMRSTSVAETLLPPARPDELVVVVWVEGTALAHPVEFRRVYRAMGEDDAAAP
ncbi:MAG: hypothetical protein KC621_07610 [Myxococcales bacterium]|nr:hypothetical protein [Myxococcales bacterium]